MRLAAAARRRKLRVLWLALAPVALLSGCRPEEKAPAPAANERHDITTEQLRTMLSDGKPLVLLDVRTPNEYAAGHLEGAMLKPVEKLSSWAKELDRSARTVCICRSGRRSQAAADQLVALGFADVYNVLGGVNAWTGELVK